MQKKKVLFLINTDWFFLMHRLTIAQSLANKDCEVIILARDTGKKKEIESLGFSFYDLNIDRKSTSFIKEILTIHKIRKFYKDIKPDAIYQVTIKPIIYGSIVARFLNIPTVNTVCGLGYSFSKNKFLRAFVTYLYRLAHKKKNTFTFFENKDDLEVFKEFGILNKLNKYDVVNGVGVNILKYFPIESNRVDHKDKIIVLLATRLLWDKGVDEFVSAAYLLRKKLFGKVYFKIIGMLDGGNPEAIPESYFEKIKISDYIEWEGFKSEMVEQYANSDIVVLPSYREGLPTVLAEACAMGKPIVTANSVGCKECVVEGGNGFKVPVKSIKELADAIEKLVLSKELRSEFGKASRGLAEEKFDQNIIVDRYTKIFEEILDIQ